MRAAGKEQPGGGSARPRQAGFDGRLEAAVPREQRPVNELEQLKDNALLSWVSAARLGLAESSYVAGWRRSLAIGLRLPTRAAKPTHPSVSSAIAPPFHPCRPLLSFLSMPSAWRLFMAACLCCWEGPSPHRHSTPQTRQAPVLALLCGLHVCRRLLLCRLQHSVPPLPAHGSNQHLAAHSPRLFLPVRTSAYFHIPIFPALPRPADLSAAA